MSCGNPDCRFCCDPELDKQLLAALHPDDLFAELRDRSASLMQRIAEVMRDEDEDDDG